VASDATCIYGLRCPLDGKIHYVGKSDNPPERLRSHLSEGRTDLSLRNNYLQRGGTLEDGHSDREIRHARRNWIAGLIDAGEQPELVILEEVANSPEQRRAAEKRWIARLASAGHPRSKRARSAGEAGYPQRGIIGKKPC